MNFQSQNYWNNKPKGPWDRVNRAWKPEKQSRVAQFQSIVTGAYNELVFSVTVCLECVFLLSLAFHSMFFFHAVAPTQCSQTAVKTGMLLTPAKPLCREICSHEEEVSAFQSLFRYCVPLLQ